MAHISATYVHVCVHAWVGMCVHVFELYDNYIVFVELFLGVKFHVMVHTLKKLWEVWPTHTTVTLVQWFVCQQLLISLYVVGMMVCTKRN